MSSSLILPRTCVTLYNTYSLHLCHYISDDSHAFKLYSGLSYVAVKYAANPHSLPVKLRAVCKTRQQPRLPLQAYLVTTHISKFILMLIKNLKDVIIIEMLVRQEAQSGNLILECQICKVLFA